MFTGSTRTHWNFFDESFETSETWIHSILAHFKQQYSAARREIDKLQKETKTNHVPSTNQSSSINMAADRPTTAEVANTPTKTSSSKAKSSSNKGQDSKYPSKVSGHTISWDVLRSPITIFRVTYCIFYFLPLCEPFFYNFFLDNPTLSYFFFIHNIFFSLKVEMTS